MFCSGYIGGLFGFLVVMWIRLLMRLGMCLGCIRVSRGCSV